MLGTVAIQRRRIEFAMAETGRAYRRAIAASQATLGHRRPVRALELFEQAHQLAGGRQGTLLLAAAFHLRQRLLHLAHAG